MELSCGYGGMEYYADIMPCILLKGHLSEKRVPMP